MQGQLHAGHVACITLNEPLCSGGNVASQLAELLPLAEGYQLLRRPFWRSSVGEAWQGSLQGILGFLLSSVAQSVG